MAKMKVICLLLLVWLVLTGCARTVTDKSITDNSGQKVTTFRDVEFTFTFAGTPAQPNYDYYLILSTQNITLKAHPDYATLAGSPYFTSPDDVNLLSGSNQRLLDDYGDINKAELRDVYAEYFANWSQYYVYNNTGQARLYRGPFVSGNILTPSNIRPAVTVSGRTLKWTMSLPLDNFYFALVAVYNGTGSQDRLFMDSVGDDQMFGINTQKQLIDMPDVTMHWENNSIGSYSGLNIENYSIRILEY